MSDSYIPRPAGPKPRACGCKGIRSCRLCIATTSTNESTDRSPVVENTPVSTFTYCQHCKKTWQVLSVTPKQSYGSFSMTEESEMSFEAVQTDNTAVQIGSTAVQIDNTAVEIGSTAVQIDNTATHESSIPDPDSNSGGNSTEGECTDAYFKVVDSNLVQSFCSHVNSSHAIEFEGIVIVENFVSEEEERLLNSAIFSSHFVNSQSGRRKQDYGPKVNFKKQKLRVQDFKGLPSYSRFLYERMKAHPHLSNFEPVELCNLEYCQNRGAHIDAHFDDSWLWGERLVTLNLMSDSVLTFTLDSEPGLTVRVPLQRRSLIVVSSAARHKWKHSILAEDIMELRLAMTFRELSQEFSAGGSRQHEGAELLKLALTFEGCAMSG